MSTKQQTINKTTIEGLTLIETIISMTLMSIIFLVVMQSFNSILLGSYMIDARTSVRNEGEFITEYFRLYAKNADARTVSCIPDTAYPANPAIQKISWQPLGTSDSYQFIYERQAVPGSTVETYGRFTMIQNGKQIILSYPDIDIAQEDVAMQCNAFTDPTTGQVINTISIRFKIDSALKLAGAPAVKDVPRNVTVTVR